MKVSRPRFKVLRFAPHSGTLSRRSSGMKHRGQPVGEVAQAGTWEANHLSTRKLLPSLLPSPTGANALAGGAGVGGVHSVLGATNLQGSTCRRGGTNRAETSPRAVKVCLRSGVVKAGGRKDGGLPNLGISTKRERYTRRLARAKTPCVTLSGVVSQPANTA